VGVSGPPDDQGPDPPPAALSTWKHFYALAWGGGADEQIRYAKAMGYAHIALNRGPANRTRFRANPDREGLKFYIIGPEKLQGMVPVVESLVIDRNQTYSPEAREFYERNMIWRTATEPFPTRASWIRMHQNRNHRLRASPRCIRA